MSLILDALNKTNREHDQDPTSSPPINPFNQNPQSVLGPDYSSRNKTHAAWPSLLIIVLLFLIGGLLLTLVIQGLNPPPIQVVNTLPPPSINAFEGVNTKEPLPKQTVLTPDPPSMAAGVKHAPENPDTNMIPKPMPSQARQAGINNLSPPKEKPPKASSSEINALYLTKNTQTSPQSKQVEASIKDNKQTLAEANTTKPNEALAQALWEASRIQDHTPLPASVLKTKAATQATTITPEPQTKPTTSSEDIDAPIEDTLAGFVHTPFLHELSTTSQNAIPTLMYAEHQYSNAYVVLNKQTLQTGESTQEGVKVERILADGVILRFKDKKFKLSSLSSWVNY